MSCFIYVFVIKKFQIWTVVLLSYFKSYKTAFIELSYIWLVERGGNPEEKGAWGAWEAGKDGTMGTTIIMHVVPNWNWTSNLCFSLVEYPPWNSIFLVSLLCWFQVFSQPSTTIMQLFIVMLKFLEKKGHEDMNKKVFT